MAVQRLSALAVSDSIEPLAVTQWHKQNMVAGVKDLSVQGKTVSQYSPEMRQAISALLVVSTYMYMYNVCRCMFAHYF
jgi:hypothetical protein